MNKKILIPIIGIAILIFSITGWRINTYSQSKLPYPNFPEKGGPNHCLQSIANEVALIRDAWNTNLQILLEQQKPASEMVDEAFESMRTYRCHLDYLCEATLFSGIADPTKLKDGEDISARLKNLPGCLNPEYIAIPNTHFKYLSYCNIPKENIATSASVESVYMQCRNLVQLEFADTTQRDEYFGHTEAGKFPAKEREKLMSSSAAFITLEKTLKNANADQKGRVLQEKLQSILMKMRGMEYNVNQLKQYIEEFDSRLPCVAPKCD